MKRIILLLALCLTTLTIGAGDYKTIKTGDGQVPDSVLGYISDSTDTARITKMDPTGYDSVTYTCTLSVPWLGDDSLADVSWTSPSQKMKLTLGAITATPTLIDTTAASGLGVVGCTVVYASTGERGIEYDCSDGADATLATALDGIKALWDAFDDLSDSIQCDDSGTYLKLISQESQVDFGGRWTMQLASSAGAPTDSIDTTSAAYITTDTMVTDSMGAILTSQTSADSAAYYVTADDSVTFYMIRSYPIVGTQFYLQTTGALAFHADTLDTTHTQAAGAGGAQSRFIEDDYIMVGQIDGYSTLQGWVWLGDALKPAAVDAGCMTNDDSARIWVYTSRDNRGKNLIDSGLCAVIPCSLDVEVPYTTGDTLLEQDLWIRIWRDDSCTQSTTPAAIYHPVKWHFKLK